jgi:riboflavin kinase/FMN adenylyltransferase
VARARLVASQGAGQVTSVVAVGTFDGVHRGHRHLLDELRRRAAARGARSLVVTFDPPPRLVLRPEADYRLLTSTDERVALLARGVDRVEVLTFDRALAATTAEQFCAGLVERHRMVELVGGPDLALGRRRAGTPPVLREIGARLGFEVTLLDQLSLGGEPVRSGEIRRRLLAGDVDGAGALLGHAPTLQGTVVLGDRRGRTLGFPTANLDVPTWRLVPANGVYAARSEGRAAVMNIGVRPTVDGTRRVVEVHLLDWAGDLYGLRLTVELVARLRDERRFPSLEALVAQIGQDVRAARAALTGR